MKEKQKNVLLCAFALAELKKRFGLSADQVIPDYNREKSAAYFDMQFSSALSETELRELAVGSYKKLKIK